MADDKVVDWGFERIKFERRRPSKRETTKRPFILVKNWQSNTPEKALPNVEESVLSPQFPRQPWQNNSKQIANKKNIGDNNEPSKAESSPISTVHDTATTSTSPDVPTLPNITTPLVKAIKSSVVVEKTPTSTLATCSPDIPSSSSIRTPDSLSRMSSNVLVKKITLTVTETTKSMSPIPDVPSSHSAVTQKRHALHSSFSMSSNSPVEKTPSSVTKTTTSPPIPDVPSSHRAVTQKRHALHSSFTMLSKSPVKKTTSTITKTTTTPPSTYVPSSHRASAQKRHALHSSFSMSSNSGIEKTPSTVAKAITIPASTFVSRSHRAVAHNLHAVQSSSNLQVEEAPSTITKTRARPPIPAVSSSHTSTAATPLLSYSPAETTTMPPMIPDVPSVVPQDGEGIPPSSPLSSIESVEQTPSIVVQKTPLSATPSTMDSKDNSKNIRKRGRPARQTRQSEKPDTEREEPQPVRSTRGRKRKQDSDDDENTVEDKQLLDNYAANRFVRIFNADQGRKVTVSEITDLDVALTTIEEQALEYRDEVETDVEKQHIKEFFIQTRKAFGQCIDVQKEFKGLQSDLRKAKSRLNKKRNELLEVQKRRTRLKGRLEKNTKEQKQKHENNQDLSEINDFVKQMKTIQRKCHRSSAGSNTHNQGTLPSMMCQMQAFLVSMTRLKSINRTLEGWLNTH